METEIIRIEDIYVPVKRRQTLEPAKVEDIAESMLEVGQKTPITIRRDGERYVLISGLPRLEAGKALGEETIAAVIGAARQH